MALKELVITRQILSLKFPANFGVLSTLLVSDNGKWESAQKKGASLAIRGEVCQYKSGCTHNSKISQNEGGD